MFEWVWWWGGGCSVIVSLVWCNHVCPTFSNVQLEIGYNCPVKPQSTLQERLYYLMGWLLSLSLQCPQVGSWPRPITTPGVHRRRSLLLLITPIIITTDWCTMSIQYRLEHKLSETPLSTLSKERLRCLFTQEAEIPLNIDTRLLKSIHRTIYGGANLVYCTCETSPKSFYWSKNRLQALYQKTLMFRKDGQLLITIGHTQDRNGAHIQTGQTVSHSYSPVKNVITRRKLSACLPTIQLI